MSYEISLEQLLKNRDAALHGRLQPLREKAVPLLSYTQGKFPYYTPHDFSHSESVEENLNWLIPDEVKESMNEYELFFTIVAAWFHDWGMIGEESENPETIRDEHHIRTEANFETMYGELSISEHEARIIGRICKGHRKVDLNTEEFDDFIFGQNFKIRRRFLAALLRIADECDITHNRTPEVIYYSINPTDQSEEEFKKHLSISGIGQLEEKHKIYISGIAREPKGARTLREVTQKIQCELDTVKGILGQDGIILDVVDLRLETRGFIDKPIAFEVDKEKIVELLIGDHLYKHQDVAIRELIQNSIDSCKLKTSMKPDFPCKIVLKRTSANEMIIDDNGLGMDFVEAKKFLSNIGASFYKSQLFQESFKEDTYSPISKFGIGILSSFLICNEITIETLKDGHEPCKFTVGSVNEEWKYEKGSLTDPGTRITLELNKEGKKIKLADSLNRYFLCPEIPIEYTDQDGESKKLEGAWEVSQIYEKFIYDPERNGDGKISEILKGSCADYDYIVATDHERSSRQLVLFNHGIFVGEFYIRALKYNVRLMVNLKKDLVDIHFSREDVKKNAKWRNFVYSLFENIFQSIKKQFNDNNDKYIAIFSRMIESRTRFEADSEAKLVEEIPFLKCFIEYAPIPVLTNGKVEIIDCRKALSGQDIRIYNCCSYSISEELGIVSKHIDDTPLIVNPYELPTISRKRSEYEGKEMFKFLLEERNAMHTELDFLQILINNSTESKIDYPELLPDNVQLATFSKNLEPLVVVYSQPVVEKRNQSLGSAYWGNILLWKELLEKDRLDSFLDEINKFYDSRHETIKIIDEPLVYIDSSDILISSVLEKRSNGEFELDISKEIHRYFKYLSYLPLVVNNISSCLIFLEVIDKLEAKICDYLQIARTPPILKRIKPKLILKYYNRYGLDYIER